MQNIFSDHEVTSEDAEANSRRYTPSVQELEEEARDEVEDRTPITDEQLARLDEATQSTFQPIFTGGSQRERAQSFVPPSEAWVHPRIKQQRRQQGLFPSLRALDDLDQRIAKVMRCDGAPKVVLAAEKEAHAAVASAREIRLDGAHPDSPRYARNNDAKDKAAVAAAQAVLAVVALEKVSSDAGEEWFDGLVAQVPGLRDEAAKALETAARVYSQWRQTIAAADALAREQGRFGEWHQHPDARELNPMGLVGDLRRARDIALDDDDWVSGAYLTADYDGIPPHTMAALEKSARIAPGSFAESVLMRLKSPHASDEPALESIAERDLRIINTRPIPALNKHQQMWDDHARAVDPARS